jgi:Fe2+ or Zn2+ uptake regulation protein
MTPQRLAILHVLHHSDGHLSPIEVYQRARAELPSLTEPTVYRTLEFLTKNGLAHSAHRRNGHLVYQIARRRHHHLKCRNCGNELEVDHTLLEALYLQLESRSGYRLTDSHVTFIGLCPECQRGE